MATKRELTGSILSAASDLRDLSDEDLDLFDTTELKALDERLWEYVESVEDRRKERKQEARFPSHKAFVERYVDAKPGPPSVGPRAQRCGVEAYRGTGTGTCNQILDEHGLCNLARLHVERG